MWAFSSQFNNKNQEKEVSTMKNSLILFLFVVVLAIATHSNIGGVLTGSENMTRFDSILVQPVLDKNNRFVVAERNVKAAEVVLSNDVPFRITVDTISKKSLQFVIDFSRDVKRAFEDEDIAVEVSLLATITDYKSDPVDYFLSESVITEKDLDQWSAYILSHEYLKNILVNRMNDGRWTFFVSVMPHDQEVAEIDLYKVVYKIMYDQEFRMIDIYFGKALQWFGLTAPAVEKAWGNGIRVDVFGWSVWRTLINKETFSFIFSVLLVESLLPALAMWLILGSFRQMFLALTCNVSVLWATRGLIGFIDLVAPFSLHEETYTILVYVPIMMLNYSFFMRHFKEYNALVYSDDENKAHDGTRLGRSVLWQKTAKNISLVSSVYFVAAVTAIDFVVFMLLPHVHGARSMASVAILATVAICAFSVPCARFVLPALHCVIGGLGKRPVEITSSWFARRVLQCSVRKSSCAVNALIVVILVVTTIFLYKEGKLITESNPGAFIRATAAGPVMDSLEREDQPGSGLYKVFIQGEDLSDPVFVQKVAQYVRDVRESDHVHGVIAPTDFLGDVLMRDFPNFCSTSQKCLQAETLNEIAREVDVPVEELLAEEWGLIAEESVSRYFFSLDDHSMIINVTGKASYTRDMRSIRSILIDQDLGAIGCDKTAQYPETDLEITEGSVMNYVGSPVLIGAVSIVLFLLVGRVRSVVGFNSYVAGAIVIVPFVVSTAITLIVMMVCGIYLDVATAAIGNITVSAAADLPVFLIMRFRQVIAEKEGSFEDILLSDDMADEVTRAGADVLVNALTYLPLALPFLTVFPPIRNLGIMLLVALASCYVGTLLMLPSLRWCAKS